MLPGLERLIVKKMLHNCTYHFCLIIIFGVFPSQDMAVFPKRGNSTSQGPSCGSGKVESETIVLGKWCARGSQEESGCWKKVTKHLNVV